MKGTDRVVKAIAIASVASLLGACATTNTDDYNTCALGYGILGLGAGLASSGTGVVLAGAVGGGALGYFVCEEEMPEPEQPEIVVVEVATAPEPVGDEDGDGVPDDRDECAGTPVGVEVDYKGCAKPLVFDSQTLNFAFNSAELPVGAADALAAAIAFTEQYEQSRFEVAGHTDSVGTDAYNQALSERRAQAVRDYLVDSGVPANRLTVVGYGEASPLSSNETDGGRARNRRVEVRLLD